MNNLTINEIDTMTSEEELIDLSAEEQQEILGGKDCVYADKVYSPGAKIDNGQVCRADGTWS